jgi:osmoprotectant transport system ATP-binding protein
VPLAEAPVARLGEAAPPRPAEGQHVLLLDADARPLGWVDVGRVDGRQLQASDADPSSPVVTFDTTLRDALSMSLATAVQTAVVVDERGTYQGVVTLDALGAAFRAAPVDHAEQAASRA